MHAARSDYPFYLILLYNLITSGKYQTSISHPHMPARPLPVPIARGHLWSFRIDDIPEFTPVEGDLRLLIVESIIVYFQRVGQTCDVSSRVEHPPWFDAGLPLARL